MNTTTYEFTIKGEVDRIAGLLTDLLETKSTVLNRNYVLEVSELGWATDLQNMSEVTGRIGIESSALKAEDIKDIRDAYSVSVSYRKAVND
jgi:hypothetical protein